MRPHQTAARTVPHWTNSVLINRPCRLVVGEAAVGLSALEGNESFCLLPTWKATLENQMGRGRDRTEEWRRKVRGFALAVSDRSPEIKAVVCGSNVRKTHLEHHLPENQAGPDCCKRGQKKSSVSTITDTGPPLVSLIGCGRSRYQNFRATPAISWGSFGVALTGAPQMLT